MCLDFFEMGLSRPHFCLFKEDFIGIWKQFFRVEGEHCENLATTTTAQVLKIFDTITLRLLGY